MLKYWITTLACLLGISFSYSQNEIDSLLNQLDRTVESHQTYNSIKENQIGVLKKQLSASNLEPEQVYDLNNQLFEAYKQYRFDSALYFIYAKLDLSETLQRTEWIQESRLKLSALLTSAGMYLESIDNLEKIDKRALPSHLIGFYYHNYKQVYESLRDYATDNKYAPQYDLKAKAYQDSLLQTLEPDTENYLMESGVQLMKSGALNEAEKIYLDFTKEKLQPGTSAYASATATLAYIYEQQGRVELQKKYRILSAISDVQAAIKENASLTDLAMQLFQEGDISRANGYIEYALNDANFYNARQRKIEISKVYPIINHAYQLQIERQKETLGFYLGIIAFISVLLGLALLWIYLQMRKLYRARKKLRQANIELQALNDRLKEANFVKEEYIGHFLNQCSIYIDKLESYQKNVRKNAIAKQINALIRMTESEAFIQSELKEFYTSFDTAFLRLYPNFVEAFNVLLNKDQRITLKKGELLNTELRIFALIRLGINDSNKIAHFLRYSVNTIYNYRAQIKNKSSIDRDQFEDQIMKIGAFPNLGV